MTSELYDSLFKKAEEYYKQDKEIINAWEVLWKAFGNSTYDMVPEVTCLSIYFDTLKMVNPRIEEHLNYYFYEALNMDTCIIRCYWDKYNAHNYEEYKEFYFNVEL